MSNNNEDSAVRHNDAPLVTKIEVAKRLAVSVRTVDNWMAAKIVPFLKIGGVVRFDMSKVELALLKFEVKGRLE